MVLETHVKKVWVQINVKNASEAQQAKAKEKQGTW